MTKKKIVYTDPITKQVCIVTPADQWMNESLLNTVELCAELSVPNGAPYRIIDEEHLPSDRHFRNAWTDEYPTHTVDINIEKAKEIHLENLRFERNQQLQKLDIDYTIAHERGHTDVVEIIKEKKQTLREMPEIAKEEMKSISSVDELKEYKPTILGSD